MFQVLHVNCQQDALKWQKISQVCLGTIGPWIDNIIFFSYANKLSGKMAAVNVGNKSNKTASKSPEYAPDKMSAEETFTLPCMC